MSEPFSAPPGWSWISRGAFVVCVPEESEWMLDEVRVATEKCGGTALGPIYGDLRDIVAVAYEHLALMSALRRLTR